MKILGLITGRPNGTTELLAKQALLGAQSKGAEVELINIRSMDIRPCICCHKCHDFQNAIAGYCPIPDDVHWIVDKIFDADGVVICCPSYEKAPPGEFKILMDRTGPGNDVLFWKMAKKLRDENPGKYDETKPVDERAFKKRFVTFIGHGGSEWIHLMLPTMMGWCTSMGYTLADKVLIPWNFSVNESDAPLERVYKSGEYVAECCAAPDEEHPFLGDKGYCPICYNDTFVLGPGTNVSCAVCGLNGTLDIQSGEFVVNATEHQKAMSHILDSGRYQHYLDLSNFGERAKRVDWAHVKARDAAIQNAIKSVKKVPKE